MENIISAHVSEILTANNIFHHSVQFPDQNTISVKIHRDKIVRISRNCVSEHCIQNKHTHWIRHLTKHLKSALSDCREEWVVCLEEGCHLSDMDTSGVKIHHIYDQDVMNGFSCFATPQEMQTLQQRYGNTIQKAHPMKNAKVKVKANNSIQTLGPFLKRIGKLNGSQSPVSPNVHVFVIDTGILANHPDLQVNQQLGRNFTSKNASAWNDDHGHGTHVAGIIGARDNKIGIMGGAPSANVIPLKVLHRQGNGSYADIIAAVQYVATWKKKNPTTPAVVNMSLGGSPFQPLDNAIRALIELGVPVVVAAGNESTNALNSSPARMETAITVGAYDLTTNRMASFSNYGSGIDIWAPGTNVDSTFLKNNYKTMSGTSMATPVVVSAIVNLLSQPQYARYTPQQIKDSLLQFAKNPQNVDKTPAKNPLIILNSKAVQSKTSAYSVYIGNI